MRKEGMDYWNIVRAGVIKEESDYRICGQKGSHCQKEAGME